MLKTFVSLGLLIACCVATPIKDALMFEGPDDTATVESTVREARAAPAHIKELLSPGVKDAFLYEYGDKENDDGDVHGYSKKLNDKGQDGYKHFDKFHKKDGDKYGYEKHSEYGQENKANIENENDKGTEDGEEAEEEEDDGEETKKSYQVIESLNEEDKKQPKKSIESEYDDEGASYESDGDEESEEGDDDGDEENEEYEESEESEEGDEEDDY